MQNVKISIEGNAIGCTPDPVEPEPLEEVRWECAGGRPFAVEFGKNHPFTVRPGCAAARGNIKVKVHKNPAKNKYKYTVAVYDAASGLVHTLDPDLIIKR